MNIGLCITGSFCTFDRILESIDLLTGAGHNVLPIVTEVVEQTDTRFGKAKDFLDKLREKTGNNVVTSIVEAEPLGPSGAIDVMCVAPCTGNTLSKLSNGISDNAVTMACKSHMRNCKPLVIAISTNDGLGLNMMSLARLMNEKNVYFVPFTQDNPTAKPKSLVSDYSLLLPTIEHATRFEQIQPVLLATS